METPHLTPPADLEIQPTALSRVFLRSRSISGNCAAFLTTLFLLR